MEIMTQIMMFGLGVKWRDTSGNRWLGLGLEA